MRGHPEGQGLAHVEVPHGPAGAFQSVRGTRIGTLVQLDVFRIFRMRYHVHSFAFLADDANADGHESSIHECHRVGSYRAGHGTRIRNLYGRYSCFVLVFNPAERLSEFVLQ